MPTQRAMEMGLFEVKESTVNNPDGSVRINRTGNKGDWQGTDVLYQQIHDSVNREEY